MASAVYPKFKEAILQAATNSDMAGGTVKVALVDTGTYTYSAAHQFLSSLTGVVGTAITLGSKTFVGGLFDAADGVFPTLSGVTVEALVIYLDTGSAATSRLIAYIDSATGFVLTPNGADLNLVWDAAGIFQL